MNRKSKSYKLARKNNRQRKLKENKKRNQIQRNTLSEAIFNGIKSKDELVRITADLQQSGRKFLVSMTAVSATEDWEELGYKNTKSFLKANVPHIKYHTAMSWYNSSKVIARLAGVEFIGVYSMNAMRVFVPLDNDQQQVLWEAVTEEWERESESEEAIDAAWLTRTKVLEVKSALFPSAQKGDETPDKVPQSNVLSSHPSGEYEFDNLDVHDGKKSLQPSNNEKVSDNDSEQDDNAFDIEEPPMSEQRLLRIKRFKRYLEKYDGSEVFALYVISWMVREYHESHPSLDKLIAKAVRDELNLLREQGCEDLEVGYEA
tara:strand:- start:8771 stop:9721 length:951 start_codon:yes stop_codon:yes gene_type:complete